MYRQGMLSDKRTVTTLDAISALCLYGIVQTEEEYMRLFPLVLSKQNVGERVLQDMRSFRYFQQKKIASSLQILEYLYKIKIHSSIWKSQKWLRYKAPRAYIKGGFLYYPEKQKGKTVQKRVWLYGRKILSIKPKSPIKRITDQLEWVD